MKKLDDLVFKNLHGLKDEDDQVKHKHDNKSLDNLSSDPQQQQQQMMYNYYNNNYSNNTVPQQYGNQAGMNQAFAQNMQHQQGMGNQNAFGMQQQFSQGNWNNAPSNQMQTGNKIPQIPHPSQNPNFAQMNPMMQKQYIHMYQMAQLQMQQMNQQTHNAFPNQGSYQNSQQQYSQQSGLNQGINSGFPAHGNPAKQSSTSSMDFNNFGSFAGGSQNMNTGNKPASNRLDDDFADFQTSNLNQNTNLQSSGNFGSVNPQRNQIDDFDDFQDASATTGKGGQKFDEGFDDFQDASVTTSTQSATANEPKNWDILDDFVEKKLPTQPQTAQNPTPQIQQPMYQNMTAQQAQYLQNQAMYQMNQQSNMFAQQQNFGGAPTQPNINANVNDHDDFEDFEEAKPSQVLKPKSPTKEDLMFGALESKAIKKMGLENIVSHSAAIDDFGDFGTLSTTPATTTGGNFQQQQHQPQDFAGDDFQDFEDAGVTKPQQEHINNPPQEHKKLTIYDIDLTEFGITENTQAPHLTEPLKAAQQTTSPEATHQKEHEDFGDFVEINEEKDTKPSQPHKNPFEFGAPQNELHFEYKANEPEKKADPSDWRFDSQPAPTQNIDHNDFGDFEEPQGAAAHQTNQLEGDGFDDFQEMATTNQKEIGKSWEHIDFPPVESQNKEPHNTDFGDFEENTNVQVQAKADEGFGDFDFPVSASANAQNQDQLFEEFTSTPTAPQGHIQNIPEEKQNENNAFDDFEEFSNPPQIVENPKVELDKAPKIEEEGEFGDFGEVQQQEPQKEVAPEQTIQVEESNPKQQVEKKLSVYDMDWAEFGIEDKNQNLPPPMQFQFGGFEDKTGQDEKKTPVSGGNALTDLYSLYGNANVTTPEAKLAEHGEDLFGEVQGAVIQEENHEDQDDFDDFEKPKPADNEGFDDFEAAPIHEDAFGNQDQNNDFADFEAASKESKPHNQAFEDPFFFPQQKEEDLFGEPSSHGVPTKVQEAHHGDDFGGFENASHASKDEPHPQDDFSDFKEPKQANPVEEQHGDDGFDDFEDAGYGDKKQDEVETPVKSLSHIGGVGLYHDNSDYGSLSEVQHPQHAIQESLVQNNLRETHDFDFKKKASPGGNDFGSFNDADQTDNQYKGAHQKDESIFHRADSSDYTPKNKKDESDENDDFGDFVGSKQELPKEAEAEHIPPSPPREEFNYTVESVLAEYGIEADHGNDAEEKINNPFEEEIEKRIGEITQEFEEKLVKSTLIRAAIKKEKFKLNNEMVEELAQELKSLQKYKEAMLTEAQVKVIAQIKELNQTKARLIDEDELEEAVKYKDLIKNKEKEQISKQKFEEFLNFYDNSDKKDYRLALLEELRAANVPNKYVNYFYFKFLGRAILPQKEVEVPVENETVEPQETAVDASEGDQKEIPTEDQPITSQEEEVPESNEQKDEPEAQVETPAEAEEQQPLENEIQIEIENHPTEEREAEPESDEKSKEIQNLDEQVGEKLSEDVNESKEEEQFDNFGQPEETLKPQEDNVKSDEGQDKKDEPEEVQKPETNDEHQNDQIEGETKDDTDQQNETSKPEGIENSHAEIKQEVDELGDFGKSQEPTQNEEEKEEDLKFDENDDTEKEENQPQAQIEVDNQNEVEQKENTREADQDDGFGGIDQPEATNKHEEGEGEGEGEFKFTENGKKEEVDNSTTKPQEQDDQHQEDDGFDGFDQPKKEENDDFKFGDQQEKENSETNKPKEQDDDFGDFDQPKKEENDDLKFDEQQEAEKPDTNKPKEQDDDFGDFDQPQKEENDDFKFDDQQEKENSETNKPKEQDDDFGDFDQPKKEENDDFKFEEAEEKKEFEEHDRSQEEANNKNEQHNEDDGFEDFGQPEVAEKQEEREGEFKFTEDGEKDEFHDDATKPQDQNEQQKEDDDFGDFDQPKKEENDDFKFDDQQEKENFETNKPKEQDDDFGDFDQPKKEENDDFKFDEQQEKDEFEDFGEPVEANETQEQQQANTDFGDFEDHQLEKQPEVVQKEKEEEEEGFRLEDIQTEEVPLTLEGLEEQKRRITQWSLMVKVMFEEKIDFKNNVRKILRQIIYEIYKFNKITSAILLEKNKDATRAILSCQKFENYVAGIQILQSFCSELQRAFQFVELENKSFKKYYKVIEDLAQKVNGLKNEIKKEFDKEFLAQVILPENSKPAEWLGEIEKLDKDALCHICHLSLRLNDGQLAEYSGSYYFLPYLNFLLNIE